MHDAFGTVLWVVCITGLVIALVALVSTRKVWDDFEKDHLLLDSEASHSHGSHSAASQFERDEEIRQMLDARNARRLRRGEQPLDVEQELARLTAPLIDAGLRAEIRDHVVARNFRRTRAGKPPLDIESEVEREIAKLSAL